MSYDRLIADILSADTVAFDAAIKASLDVIEIPTFVSYLHQHKIGGIIADRLKELKLYDLLATELINALDKYKRALTLYNQMSREELIRFVKCTSAPVYLVKGIAFECAELYPSGVRAVGDLDVVMSYPSCTDAWDKAIESGDYQAQEGFPSTIHKRILSRFPSYEHHHLPALRSKEFHMLSIEIHPQIFNPPMDVNADMENLFYKYSLEALSSAKPIPNIPGCYQLDEVHHFLFICLHLLDNWRKGEVTWRMLCDVQYFLRAHPELDWDKCMNIAKQLRQFPSIIQSLGIVSTYLTIPVPATIDLHFEDFPAQIQLLNLMGMEYYTRVSLSKRLLFYLRHMNVYEMIVYAFRTLFPSRSYLKLRYARRYAAKGYIKCLMNHLLEKLKFFFNIT